MIEKKLLDFRAQFVPAGEDLFPWRCFITREDRRRIFYLLERHQLGRQAEVVRYVLQRYLGAIRDRTHQDLIQRGLRTCVQMAGRWTRANQTWYTQVQAREDNQGRIKTEAIMMRLSREDLDRIETVRKYHSLGKKAEAVRLALFVVAELDGFQTDEVTT